MGDFNSDFVPVLAVVRPVSFVDTTIRVRLNANTFAGGQIGEEEQGKGRTIAHVTEELSHIDVLIGP